MATSRVCISAVLLSAALAVVALAGCGGSSHVVLRSASSQSSDSATTVGSGTGVAPSGGATPPTAPGKPTTSHLSSPAASGQSPGLNGTSQQIPAADRTTIAVADGVCRAIRAGAPAPLHRPVTAQSLSGYARIAIPYSHRTQVSLLRLSALHPTVTVLRVLQDDYQHLAELYGQASTGGTPVAPLATDVSRAEQRAGYDARAGGLPLCAPFAPSVVSATQ